MEENKKYSIIGKVEIGTDEYRDLIESSLNSSKSADEYRSKYWAEQNKVNELKKQVEVLNAKVKKCEIYMQKSIKENKGDNDIVSIFMSLFGEE